MIRIVVADDHQLIREGLCALIRSEPDMEVVGQAGHGRDVVALVSRKQPDIVLMDVAMPTLNGVDAARQISQLDTPARVIAVSMHDDRRFVQGIFQAGAVGYVLKDSAFEELARAVRVVASGKVYLSPAVAAHVVDGFVENTGEKSNGSVLSAREREVLQLVAEGGSTKVIAQELHIGVKTVETHRRQLMKKLEIFSVAELTKYAVRHGLSSLES